MAQEETREERDQRLAREAFEAREERVKEQEQWAEENRGDSDVAETREEAEERIATVRATQIFGDTPTDQTIGDTVVVAHDEEGGNVAQAEVDAAAEAGEGSADDLSPGEAKRQDEALDAETVDEAASEGDESEGDEEPSNEEE